MANTPKTTVEQTAPVQNSATETIIPSESLTLDSSSEGSESKETPKQDPAPVDRHEVVARFKGKMAEAKEKNKGSKSPFLSKAVYGGTTQEIVLLLRRDGSPIPMIKVSGVSDHAAALILDKGKHTFLTEGEYSLIEGTMKDCDLPSLDEVPSMYHKFLSEDCDIAQRAVAAVRLRMALTQDGQVKAA